jgi:ATP-dependent metalloprotease
MLTKAQDLESATNQAFAMVARYGMSKKLGPMEFGRRYELLSSETKSQVESEVQRMLNEGYDNARKLLLSKRKELDLLAKALVQYETLETSEVDIVLRGGKLTDRVPVPRGPITVPAPLKEPVAALPPPLGGSGAAEPPPPPPPATA